MQVVTVRILKARASELLRAVERGEQVTVTRRGRPIARIERAEVDERRPMRLRGLLAGLAPGLDQSDLVSEIREMRRTWTSEIEGAYGSSENHG